MLSPLIYELMIKDFTPQLQSQLVQLDNATISLPNKSKAISILDTIRHIQNINPHLTIIPYYSCKYHQQKTREQIIQAFINLLQELSLLHIPEILLVSGVPKPKYDSLSLLKDIAPLYKAEYPRIAVAYNPFLQGIELDQENIRLKTKIQTNILSSIYLQIGINTNIIRKAVEYIRYLQPNLATYISLMNPSPARLAQFRYRPWKGVLLPPEYTNSSDNAQHINTQLYLLAEELNIGIIQGQ